MSTINIHNCEAFFLDFYEGNLNPAQERELQNFLNQHPDWKQVFQEYGEVDTDDVVLSDNDTLFDARETLLFTDQDEDLIALLEGQLSPADAKTLEEKIAGDITLSKEFQLFQKTRLQPELDIRFPEKKKLKKFAPVIPIVLRYSSVAALLAGAVFTISLFNISEPDTPLVQDFEPEPIQETPVLLPEVNVTVASPEIMVPEIASVSKVAALQKVKQQPEESAPEVHVELLNANEPEPLQTMESIPVKPTGLLPMDSPKPEFVASTEKLAQPTLPGFEEEEPVAEVSEERSRSLMGSLVSFAGQTLLDKAKNISEEKVLIEQKADVEEEVYSSTFRLGAFEVYRSKSSK